MTNTPDTYIDVILPLPLKNLYTYQVPKQMETDVHFGKRVEIQFGKIRKYAGIVVKVHHEKPDYKTKPIIQVIDDEPIIFPYQYKMWEWLASYYCCKIGEVMNIALPSGFKMNSETKVLLHPQYDGNHQDLNDKEYLIAEALLINRSLTLNDIQQILNQKSIYSVVNALLEKNVALLEEELQESFKPIIKKTVKLSESYTGANLSQAFEKVKRSLHQTHVLLAYIELSKKQQIILQDEINKIAGTTSAIIKEVIKKGIFVEGEIVGSRIASEKSSNYFSPNLTEVQEKTLSDIKKSLDDFPITLFYGVTGSGKTEIYVQLIEETIKKGKQVLYLLPEIALSNQIIVRLKKFFGDKIIAYHSKINNNERVEIWNKTKNGIPIILGARSSIFLPFNDLGLIIIDEEHDTSFKQNDPAPRYHARDAAIYLSTLLSCKVLLGSATPSIESYYNSIHKKYGLVQLNERFNGALMPEINFINIKNEKQNTHYSSILMNEIKNTLDNKEQVIIFRNRRGFAPVIRCEICGWHEECKNCDVSLTYHQHKNSMHCHYCGFETKVPSNCKACGSPKVKLIGFGTEKIEEDFNLLFKDTKIGRMDLDTSRKKDALNQLITDFEDHNIDILIGTQMVTKGLDFDNVGLVGVLSADQMLLNADFRANERTYQMLVQVSGRSGRKDKIGKVFIQTFQPNHIVLSDVKNNDFANLFKREIAERQQFKFPPFYRLINLIVKHKDQSTAQKGAYLLASKLKDSFGERISGPNVPNISRIRNHYHYTILIKLEKNKQLIESIKKLIPEFVDNITKQNNFSNLKIIIDVDPV
ncbi:MAG: primosomal protein N' [Saprospiraceae bacterium]|nr:primosomal protein N' [Saprospiraceae bacterium]